VLAISRLLTLYESCSGLIAFTVLFVVLGFAFMVLWFYVIIIFALLGWFHVAAV